MVSYTNGYCFGNLLLNFPYQHLFCKFNFDFAASGFCNYLCNSNSFKYFRKIQFSNEKEYLRYATSYNY